MSGRGGKLARQALNSGKSASSAWEDMQARNASTDWDVDEAIERREFLFSKNPDFEWVGFHDRLIKQGDSDEDRRRHTE